MTAVGDDELKRVALRLRSLFQAAKASGGPSAGAIRDLAGCAGIGPRHVDVLREVVDGGEMSVSALGARLGVALPTASLLVGELSRAGLLERFEDDGDRRRTLVRLPRERAELLERCLLRRLDPLRQALLRLTHEERAAFAKGLELVAEELAAAEGEGTPAARVAAPS